MKKKASLYFHFARPFTLLPPALGMLSGSFIALGSVRMDEIGLTIVGVKILAGTLVAALLNVASNGINQIFDLEIDRVNKPNRPLPSGELSLPEAWIITISCYFLTLVLAWLLSPMCAMIVALGAFFTIVYSVPPLRTKKHWLAAAITISIPRGILLKVAGWAVLADVFAIEPWYIGCIFGLFLLGATTTKDYADMQGDQQGHCTTLPLRFGIKNSIWIIAPFFTFPFLLFPLGVEIGVLKGNAYLLRFLGISLFFWGGYVIATLLKDPHSLTRTENHPSWLHMYLMMMYAQIALAFAYIL